MTLMRLREWDLFIYYMTCKEQQEQQRPPPPRNQTRLIIALPLILVHKS